MITHTAWPPITPSGRFIYEVFLNFTFGTIVPGQMDEVEALENILDKKNCVLKSSQPSVIFRSMEKGYSMHY